jgi:hypothetical protein
MTVLRPWWRIWAGIIFGAAGAAALAAAWHLGHLADKLGISPADGPAACYLGMCRQTTREIEQELAAMRHPPRPGDGIAVLAFMILVAGLLMITNAVGQVLCGLGEHWEGVTATIGRAHAQWQVPATRDLWLLAALMPAGQRERWLAEILSALHEAGPGWRRQIIRGFRANAPRVLFLAWGATLRRAARRWLRASRR